MTPTSSSSNGRTAARAAALAAAAVAVAVAVGAPAAARAGQTRNVPVGGGGGAQTPASQVRPGAAGRQFLEMAARGNAAEIAAGRLALQRSQNEDVRRIAQRLIDDHSQAQTRLTAVARKNDIANLPASPDPLHREMESRLRAAASGDEFDRMFLAGQVRDHLMAISLYEHAANLAQDPDLSAFALNTLPGLRAHADEIVRAAQRMGLRVAAMDLPAFGAGASVATMRGEPSPDVRTTAPGGTTPAGTPPVAPGTGAPVPPGTPGATPPPPATTGDVIALNAIRSAPAGYMNRNLVGTARIGEKLGDRVFFLVQTTGAASVAAPGGTGAAPGGVPGATTGAAQGILAVLDDSFMEANTPRLLTGQTVQITAIARTPAQVGGAMFGNVPSDVRERIDREPVVLLIRRIAVTGAALTPSGSGRPGS